LKLVRNVPPADKALAERLRAEGWRKIKEPRRLTQAILMALPLMFIAGVTSLGVIRLFYAPVGILAGASISITISINPATLGYLAALLALTPLHEMIHALAIPDVFRSNRTVLGLRPFGGFVATTQILTRNRFILVSTSPFLVLSIVLPVILGLFSQLNGFWAFLVILNALGSGVDLLNIVLILHQTPLNSRIVNNAFETYYRPEKKGPATATEKS